MAAFSRKDLRKWRDSLSVSAIELAKIVPCDVSTIYKYEAGTIKHLTPDAMFKICDSLGDRNVWCDWMRTEFSESYGIVHPEAEAFELPGALMQMLAETEDVVDLQRAAMRDAANGRFDDPQLKADIEKEVSEMIGAAQRFLNLIRSTRQR